MIVKNEELNLPRCISSVNDLVDEIVIVDTGSSDNTIKIAKEFDAKIIEHKWNDDFSEARNIALRNSSGDFILYLDADEILSAQSKSEIIKLTKKKEKLGYLCTITSIDEFTKQNNSIQYVRFFRNSDELEFKGKAHEQIVDSLLENGFKILPSNIEIFHYGYNISKEEKKRKSLRNLKLLLNDLEKTPTSYKYFQIGQSYFILDNYTEAEKYFNLAVSSDTLSNDLKAESYSYLAQICHFNYDVINTDKNVKKAISLNNNQPYYHYLLSKVFQRKLDNVNALNSLIKAFELNNLSMKIKKNNLQTVHLNNYELLCSILYLAKNISDSKTLSIYSNELIKEVNKNNPKKSEQFKLFIKLIINNLIPDKDNFNELLKIIDDNNLELFLKLIDPIPDVELKLEFIRKLNEMFPVKIEVLKKLSIILESLNKVEDSIKLLEDNFELLKNDPSALFYLASFHIKCNNYKRSLEIFNLIENNFPNISSLNSKVKLIKEKLAQLER